VIRLLLKTRHVSFALTLLALVLLAIFGKRVGYEQSIKSFFADDDPHMAAYQAAAKVFGDDNFVFIAYDDPDLLTSAGMDRVAELAAAVGAHRTVPGDLAGFDIAIGGRRRLASVEAERAAVDAAARGGATWWVEYIHPGPPDEMFQGVRRGPVRATADIG
jgi:hypothetical protein